MIMITLGSKNEFYISDDNQMGIRQVRNGKVEQDINLGEATQSNLDNLFLNMDKLYHHMTSNGR